MRRFRPGLTLTLAWAFATAVLIALGSWQLARLAWKNELVTRAEAALRAPPEPLPPSLGDGETFEFRRVRASGAYLPNTALALGFVVRGGQPGARLLNAFRLEDGRVLFIDRGFVPEERLVEALRRPPPVGPRVLEGVLRRGPQGGWATPQPDRSLPRWYAFDHKAIGDHFQLDPEPLLLVLEQPEAGAESLARPEPVVVDLPNPHLGYAATWFGLAAALLVFYILLGRNAAEGSR